MPCWALDYVSRPPVVKPAGPLVRAGVRSEALASRAAKHTLLLSAIKDIPTNKEADTLLLSTGQNEEGDATSTSGPPWCHGNNKDQGTS